MYQTKFLYQFNRVHKGELTDIQEKSARSCDIIYFIQVTSSLPVEFMQENPKKLKS